MSEFKRTISALLPRLRRLAWVVARNEEDAQDLLQSTLLRALDRRESWEEGSRLDLWMFRIMKNIWVDEIRSRSRWAQVVQPMPEFKDISDAGAGMDASEKHIEKNRIWLAVEKLPEDQRLPIKLVLLDGLSYSEAADILEIPEGTLTSRLSRGRAAILLQFEQSGDLQ